MFDQQNTNPNITTNTLKDVLANKKENTDVQKMPVNSGEDYLNSFTNLTSNIPVGNWKSHKDKTHKGQAFEYLSSMMDKVSKTPKFMTDIENKYKFRPKNVSYSKQPTSFAVQKTQYVPAKQSGELINGYNPKVVKDAIMQVETGGVARHGASGENGRFQFMPATWNIVAKQYAKANNINQQLAMTPENEDKVATWKVTELLKKGYTPEEVGLVWNTSLGGSEKPLRKVGTNAKGVKYNSIQYGNKVKNTYNNLLNSLGGTRQSSYVDYNRSKTYNPRFKKVLNPFLLDKQGAYHVSMRPRGKKYATECAEYINDIAGTHFGDSLQSKIRMTDKEIGRSRKKPIKKGTVIVTDEGGNRYGHVVMANTDPQFDRLVGKYYVTVSESNYKKKNGKGIVTHNRKIYLDSPHIKGFVYPNRNIDFSNPDQYTGTGGAVEKSNVEVSPMVNVPSNNVNADFSGLGNLTTPYGGHTRTEIFHPAVDIANAKGTPVPAFASGKVVKTEYDPTGYGKNVVIKDNLGQQHRYSHFNNIDVAQGQNVNTGQKIGTMGDTGNTYSNNGGDRSHVDYRIKNANGDYIEPTKYLANVFKTKII